MWIVRREPPSHMFVFYCSRDLFSSREMKILGQPERWLETIFGFYQFWLVLTSSETALGTAPQTTWHKECSSAGTARHKLTSAQQWIAHNLIREDHLDRHLMVDSHDPQDSRSHLFYELFGAVPLNALDAKLPSKPFQHANRQFQSDSKFVLSWL